MTHTPGPWKARKRYYADFDLPHWEVAYGDMEAHRLVAGYVRSEANARLIAAAPEMKVWIEEMRAAIIEGNSDAITALLTTGRALLWRIDGEEDHND